MKNARNGLYYSRHKRRKSVSIPEYITDSFCNRCEGYNIWGVILKYRTKDDCTDFSLRGTRVKRGSGQSRRVYMNCSLAHFRM
jgi:hypothetical protein